MGYLYHRRVPSVATLTAGKRGKQAQIGKVEHATCDTCVPPEPPSAGLSDIKTLGDIHTSWIQLWLRPFGRHLLLPKSRQLVRTGWHNKHQMLEVENRGLLCCSSRKNLVAVLRAFRVPHTFLLSSLCYICSFSM